MPRPNVNDYGFSLAELLVAVALLGMILAAVYAGVQVAQSGSRVATREAQFEQEVASPLHTMDKWLSQNKVLVSGDNYGLTFKGPTDDITHRYNKYVVAAGTDGRLTEAVYAGNAATGVETLKSRGTWSTSNVNRARAKYLFTYLDANGNTLAPAAAPASARSVIVEVWASHEGRDFSGKRQIFFRNR